MKFAKSLSNNGKPFSVTPRSHNQEYSCDIQTEEGWAGCQASDDGFRY